mmetsp:Transcript_5945/g.12737  ORF Transcript_5945/g.12737 Transcript_5945/m.12737 type:complete len:80 (-) Transcript_5945:3-242(-)
MKTEENNGDNLSPLHRINLPSWNTKDSTTTEEVLNTRRRIENNKKHVWKSEKQSIKPVQFLKSLDQKAFVLGLVVGGTA